MTFALSACLKVGGIASCSPAPTRRSMLSRPRSPPPPAGAAAPQDLLRAAGLVLLAVLHVLRRVRLLGPDVLRQGHDRRYRRHDRCAAGLHHSRHLPGVLASASSHAVASAPPPGSFGMFIAKIAIVTTDTPYIEQTALSLMAPTAFASGIDIIADFEKNEQLLDSGSMSESSAQPSTPATGQLARVEGLSQLCCCLCRCDGGQLQLPDRPGDAVG